MHILVMRLKTDLQQWKVSLVSHCKILSVAHGKNIYLLFRSSSCMNEETYIGHLKKNEMNRISNYKATVLRLVCILRCKLIS